MSPNDAYALVTINGVTGLYKYRKDGKRDQPLQFVASIQDLVDVFQLNILEDQE